MSSHQDGYAPRFGRLRLKWWNPLRIVVLSFRYFMTGNELWGRGDNATFLHAATIDHRRRPYEKLTQARWRRVLRRWAFLLIPALLMIFTPVWVWVAYVYVLAALALHFGAEPVAVWWDAREYRNSYIIPAAKVLIHVTGVKLKKREMLAAIELPRGFGEEIEDGQTPLPARVYVPEVALDDGMKTRIATTVGQRLGLPEPEAVWVDSGVERRYVELYPKVVPPSTLTLAQIMAEILASDMDHPVVGGMLGGGVSRMDMVNDSPHTLGSAGSGAGKSTLYKFIAMQRMHLGAYAIILDFKKWSHLRWAGRLPSNRVRIEDEIGKIHEVLGLVLDELLWRKSFELEDEEKLKGLPVLDVYVEEINTLMPMLEAYWIEYTASRKMRARIRVRKAKEAIKSCGRGEEVPDAFHAELEEAEEALIAALSLPRKSPAIQAIKYGVNLGREFRVHFHFIGQSIDAVAAGGRNTRESFKTRMLARWDMKTWKMLADGVRYVSCPSGAVGIWAHVHDGRVDIVRVPYVDDMEAVQFVLDGIRPPGPMFHGEPYSSIEENTSKVELPTALPLSALVDLLPLKADGDRMTLNALRLAAGRPGFPAPVTASTPGKAALYAPDDVLAWFTSTRAALTN